MLLVRAAAGPGSARGHAALEVAQEAAHAASAPRGGGDGGLVGLDVGVVLLLLVVPRRPAARRGAGWRQRRAGRLGSEERGVVVVAGGHGDAAPRSRGCVCQGSARRIEIWSGGCEPGRQSGEVDERGGVRAQMAVLTRGRAATPTREGSGVRRPRGRDCEREHKHGRVAVAEKQRQAGGARPTDRRAARTCDPRACRPKSNGKRRCLLQLRACVNLI
jgi:hypothetical protein